MFTSFSFQSAYYWQYPFLFLQRGFCLGLGSVSCCFLWLSVFVLPQWIRTSGLGKCISTLRRRVLVFDLPSRSVQIRESFYNLSSYYKGGPNSVSKNHISFRCKKRTPKLASCTFLSWLWQPFPFYYVDARGRMFPKHAIEALRGSARPGRGHASDAKRIGIRTKRGS